VVSAALHDHPSTDATHTGRAHNIERLMSCITTGVTVLTEPDEHPQRPPIFAATPSTVMFGTRGTAKDNPPAAAGCQCRAAVSCARTRAQPATGVGSGHAAPI
jgi:hypothetical protein